MIDPLDGTHRFALDAKDVGRLRHAARENSPQALKEAARQFEALFMNMMLKSMREATPQDGLFDNDQTRMYTSMLDQQLSQTMASRGIGLADIMIRQLSTYTDTGAGLQNGAVEPAGHETPQPAHSLQRLPPAAAGSQPEHVQAFRQRMAPYAEEASRISGIPARFVLGQAALESGWGKREILGADGSNSFNVFGIKAGGGWTGRTVDVTTTEYVDGVPQRRVEKFRAYDSYADAFRDYARLMRNSPRYAEVIASAQSNPADASAFARSMQRAGYATDPQYADKLARVINRSLSI